MQTILNFFVGTLNDIAWLYAFLPCVMIGGIFLTVRTGAVQFKHFSYAMKHTVGRLFEKKDAGDGAVTPLQAVTTALAATVGTGNIVGTSQAIALGGYGAVFWLWVAATLGMVIKYSEVVLSIHYRQRDNKGDWVGGPMYYISAIGPKWKWLALVFAVFASLASFGIGNMSQANAITGSVVGAVGSFVALDASSSSIIRWVMGIVLAVLVGVVLIGGIKRIGRVTEKLVPVMSIFYILVCLVVVICNISSLPAAFGKIFSAVFSTRAVMGAASGIALKEALVWGLRRSAFSNEAGLGSAAIAHAAADTPSAVDQGFYGIFEVFMDTIAICSLTALTIICSGVDISFGVKPGSELITAAVATVFGDKIASLFVALALVLFAFSTVLGWALYGTRCVQYIFGDKVIRIYQIIFAIVVVVGCVSPIDIVWDIADTFNGLMAIPNFVGLFALSGVVFKLTREYFNDPKRKLK